MMVETSTVRKLAAAIVAASLTLGSAAAEQGVKAGVVKLPVPAQIDRNGVLILLRETFLALDQANKTGNYTVLRDLSAPTFQKNTAAQLSEGFAWQRKERLDLSGIAVLEPQLTVLPQIEPNGAMRFAGFFPSVPAQIKFEVAYEPLDGQWRLSGIAISLAPSGPVAPAPPAAPQKKSDEHRESVH